MDPTFKRFLLKSPELRKAIWKELRNLLLLIIFYIIGMACARFVFKRPFETFWQEATIGACVFFLCWLVNVVRTIRQVMRDNSLL